MTVTIWHNPKCSTSRKVLGIIRARGVEPKIVDYVNVPPSVASIKSAPKAMGVKPRGLLRRRGTPYDELGLGDDTLSEIALIEAMHAHPILIEPVVASPKGTRLCRPPEVVEELL
jgi:arsenate reductase (glutaredoxin)